MIRRREFITLLGSAVAAWPVAARAQQASAIAHVGLLSTGADSSNALLFRPFMEALRNLGYVEDHNIVLERRFAGGRDELIGEFGADLVARKVDVIVATGIREALVAQRATSAIPIVTIAHPDPVGMGLASSLARPGGNLTGLTTMDWGLYGKRIEILKEALPQLTKVALLLSRTNPSYARGTPWARGVEADARSLGIELAIVEIEADGIEAAIAPAAAGGFQSLIGASDGVVLARRKDIADSAIRHRLPTIFAFRQSVEAGGLMMYGARISDLSRRAAVFVDRLLKGANPAALPIEQPTVFELLINLKTANLLGLTLPPTLLARADEVIE